MSLSVGVKGGVFLLLGLSLLVRCTHFFMSARILPLSGDESFYFSGAADLIRLVTNIDDFGGPVFQSAMDGILGHGWFLPGMSAVLALVRPFSDSVPVARLFVGAINFCLFSLIVREVYRVFGGRSALVVSAVGAAFPTMTVFSFVFWGEMIGGQLLALTLFHLCALHRRVRLGEQVGSFRWATVGMLLLALIYIRPSLILVVPVVLGFTGLVLVHEFGVPIGLRRTLRATLPMVAVVLLGVLPWSLALSSRMGGLYLTTTSMELGRVVMYGDQEALDAITHGGNPWHRVADHVWARAKREAKSYSDVMKEEKKRLTVNAGFEDYVRAVKRNVHGYLLAPNAFLERFRRLSSGVAPTPEKRSAINAYYAFLERLNSALWYPLILISMALVTIPSSAARDRWWFSLLFKAVFLAMVVHPFVAVAHGRHHVALLPLAIVTTTAVFSSPRAWTLLSGSSPPRTWTERCCRYAQFLFTFAVAAGFALVLFF